MSATTFIVSCGLMLAGHDLATRGHSRAFRWSGVFFFAVGAGFALTASVRLLGGDV